MDNTPVQSDNIAQTSETGRIIEGTTEYVVSNVDVSLKLPRAIPSMYDNSYFPNDVTSVISYLAKPVPIASGAWNISGAAGTLLFNQDMWTGVFNNTMWKEKLHGFYGLRATLRVDLVLNATPFHQGRLRLCYYPCASINSAKAAAHITHRIPLSQLPGVEIGCGDCSVSLTIPYVAPGRFIELTSAGNVISWGNLYLVIMSQLSTGASGDSTADYTIWYSMHDVELIGQTNKAVQQSGVGKGKPKRITPSEQEQRPVSHILGAAADFAGNVAKIPLLTPWAGPVSWFLNAAKGAAFAFGFAKPINTEKPCLMSSNYNWYTTTSDGIDNSMPLALLTDAKLRLLDDVNESGEDQMSINFIKRQWSFYNTFSVSESDTLGLQLYRADLTPTLFFSNPSGFEYYYTPVTYLSKFFGIYRGGLEFMFKFVKTGFHAGSLAVTFVPGPHDNTMTFTDSSYAYRTVIDLQEGDEACFRCPYLLPLDYINCDIGCGAIYVHVVNPLRSPETCASSFEVLVYVRGAESLQFQKPRDWSALPVIPQGGEVENISEHIVCDAPGNGPVAPLNLDFCQDSISECATSLLQLIKRFNSLQIVWASGADDIAVVIPWALSCKRFVASTLSGPQQIYDPITSQVLAPFAFYRGGMRWRVTPIGTGTDVNAPYMCRSDGLDVNAVQFVKTDLASTLTTYGLPPTSNFNPIGTQLSQLEPIATNNFAFGGLSVQVPYQNVYRFCPVQFAHTATATGTFLTPRAKLNIYLGTSRNRLITRAAADDFQALFWVGIPRFDS